MKNKLRLLLLPALAFAALTARAETYALMVGINDYPEFTDDKGNKVDDDLKGCVNDIKNYNDLLVNKFGVKSANIKTLFDKNANADGFVNGVKWLMNAAKPGDQIIFVYSGHGTQYDDPDVDEVDKKQEAIVLADEKLVTGNFFHEVSQMATTAGLNATFVFDSCYSGGVTRDPIEEKSFEGKPAFARNRRLLPTHVTHPKPLELAKRNEIKESIRKGRGAAAAGSYMFLLAGREDQTTADLEFKDKTLPARGLFSLVFGMYLDQEPEKPVEELMNETVALLKDKGFEQVPQFEFSSAERGKQPFFLK